MDEKTSGVIKTFFPNFKQIYESAFLNDIRYNKIHKKQMSQQNLKNLCINLWLTDSSEEAQC